MLSASEEVQIDIFLKNHTSLRYLVHEGKACSPIRKEANVLHGPCASFQEWFDSVQDLDVLAKEEGGEALGSDICFKN